jgi:imidazolonepropionase-like amidohydrolase
MFVRPFALATLAALSVLSSGCVGRPGTTPGPSGASSVAGPSLEFANGRWYTGTGFSNRTLYSVNGVLRTERPARIDSVLDLGGGFVVPPFGDAHTHNLDGTSNIDRVRDAYVREGTFYVQVLTNSTSGAQQVRSRFNRACDLDVVYSNGGITSTLSHPFLAYEPRAMGLYADWESKADSIRRSRLREGNAYWFIDSVADLDVKWPKILAAHPGVIKIFLLDAMEHPPEMPATGLPSGHGLRPSLVPEIVRRAHSAGLRVAAHIETAADFKVAVEAGVDMMAHAPGYAMGVNARGQATVGGSAARFEIGEDIARVAGARGVAVTPSFRWTYGGGGPDSAAAVSARHVLMRHNLGRLRAAGVRLIIGSDWFGSTAFTEVELLRSLDFFSDAELFRMWAVETPRSIFPERRIGALEPGYEASFLVLGTNPLERFDALNDIRLRVKQGCVLGVASQ